MTEAMIMIMVTSVPAIPPTRIEISPIMRTKLIGTRWVKSLMALSENELFNMTTPEM